MLTGYKQAMDPRKFAHAKRLKANARRTATNARRTATRKVPFEAQNLVIIFGIEVFVLF